MTDTDDQTEERPTPFRSTITGQVVIGICIAIGSAIITWSSGVLTTEAEPPSVSVSPEILTASAGSVVEFQVETSALNGSVRWTVGGLSPDETAVAACTTIRNAFQCRFFLPGTFAVGAVVTSETGLSNQATASVTVDVPGGYLGVVVVDPNEDALRALLYDVDWGLMQLHSSRPIVLYDPDTNAPVYATSVQIPQGTPDPAPWSGAAEGMQVLVPNGSPSFGYELSIQLSEIGAIAIAESGGSGTISALTAGSAESGVVFIDNPDDIFDFQSR